MSSEKSLPPLVLNLRFPVFLVSLLVLMHIGAMVILSVLVLPLSVKLLFAVLLALSLLFILKQLPGLTRPANISRLTLTADNRWLIDSFDGARIEANKLSSNFVHPWLIILDLRVDGVRGSRPVVLFADSLDRDSFRRLCVRLKVLGENVSVL